MWIYRVEVTCFAEKQLRRLPRYIQEALYVWAKTVEASGMGTTRKLPGYHDEPLRGKRYGQRSVRLSRSYRVIYEERASGKIIVIAVLEVSKHDY